MKIPGKQTFERIINYHAISANRLRGYLDHLRKGVASFPANEHNKIAMDEMIHFLENNVLKNLKKSIILDIGCGDGYMLNQIKNRHNSTNLIGISVCRGDIALAKEMHNVKVKFGDMHNIPLTNNSIDTILARHCLEHSAMPLLALYEMYRVINKEKGVVAVTLPAYDPYWVQFDGHFHCMPKNNWLKLFEVAGFEVSHEESGYWFALATNKDETEWRFILKPKNEKKYMQAFRPFYADILSELKSSIKRALV